MLLICLFITKNCFEEKCTFDISEKIKVTKMFVGSNCMPLAAGKHNPSNAALETDLILFV